MNKKTVIFFTFALIASTCLVAQTAKTAPKANLTPEERAARRAKFEAMRMKKVGGIVARPGTQNGEVVYVNCQKRAPKEWIDESIAYFTKETKFKITYKEGSFDFASPKIEGNATLFVIDDEKMPALIIAPENRWAFVNVAVVAKEKRPAFFQARVKKQLTRGFAFLCGASNSHFPGALTRGIVKQTDLDENLDLRLPVDVIARFRTYMLPLGVTPRMDVTYMQACKEGWAPTPTNEYQKAIWERIKADKERGPTNPLKIPMPKKRK